jgi:hypothetical protein
VAVLRASAKQTSRFPATAGVPAAAIDVIDDRSRVIGLRLERSQLRRFLEPKPCSCERLGDSEKPENPGAAGRLNAVLAGTQRTGAASHGPGVSDALEGAATLALDLRL